MGYLLGRSFPISPVVTRKEYLNAVDCAFASLSYQHRGTAYQSALDDLAAGHPVRAARAFSFLLKRQPDNATLHRMLGISYCRAGKARLATRHLERALVLLTRASTRRTSLVHSLHIEVEASVVRLALMSVYNCLGHRARVVGCLLAQTRPLAWDIHSRSRI